MYVHGVGVNEVERDVLHECLVIERRGVTLCYHGRNFSGSQPSFLTEKTICISERCQRSMS